MFVFLRVTRGGCDGIHIPTPPGGREEQGRGKMNKIGFIDYLIVSLIVSLIV
jgi:hypothetical protein